MGEGSCEGSRGYRVLGFLSSRLGGAVDLWANGLVAAFEPRVLDAERRAVLFDDAPEVVVEAGWVFDGDVELHLDFVVIVFCEVLDDLSHDLEEVSSGLVEVDVYDPVE